jgi:hypothetical protein
MSEAEALIFTFIAGYFFGAVCMVVWIWLMMT